MSSLIDSKIRILWKMYLKLYIGEKHTAPQTVLKTIKSPNAAKALKQLIKDGLVISHPTSYGNQISLNHNRIEEIEKLIQGLE